MTESQSIPLRVLIVEDSQESAKLLAMFLQTAGYQPEYLRVETEAAMREALQSASWDLILCDHYMPQFDSVGALAVLKESGQDIPFIIVSGVMGEEQAVEMMTRGAHDYILKPNYHRLIPAIQRELREAQKRRELKRLIEAQRNLEWAAFLQAAHSLIGLQSQAEIERHLAGLIGKFLKADFIAYAKPSADGKTFQIYVPEAAEKFPAEWFTSASPVTCEAAAETWASGKAVTRIVTTPSTWSLAFVPVREGGQINSVLVVAHRGQTEATPELLGFYQAAADFAGTAMELARHRYQLAELVAERTAEISAKNERLREEIAERQRVETALRESEEQFRIISSAAQDAILMMDNDGNICFWNPAAERIFGYLASEVLGQNLHDLLAPPVYREANRQMFARWRETGEGSAIGKTLELTAMRKDGTVFPVELSLSSVRVRGRWQAIGILRDITERKRIEEELAKARDAALQSVRLKSEFLANMSHEIRTPMNGVIGMTSLLLDTPLTEQQAHYVETIRTCGEALLTIINDILDFSKIEAGKLNIEITDFNLRDTFESTLELVAERAAAKKLELIGEIRPNTPTLLRGDAGRLRQILLNLLSNAIKFTEQGEVVARVELGRQSGNQVELHFTVRDTGVGIPAEAQARLFQPFSQADGSTTRKYGGTGLGLVISKKLVEMMGGQIGLESVPGQGAKFWFTVWLEKQPGHADSAATSPLPDLANLRVLIVDDNATNREILEHQVRAWKMQPASAGSSAEALRLLESASPSEPFAIALLDQQMPEMDGLMLAKRIKSSMLQTTPRMVLLSSLGQKPTEEELQSAGISACLTKPVRQSMLFDCLANVMGMAPATRRRITPTPAAPRAATRPLRILVAEDNPINQQVALSQLKKLGYTADAVGNGLEACEAVARGDYDVVLMDCQMPEMDGYEATRLIRKREQETRCKRVRIIAMTAHALAGDRETCLAAGMDDYISKPVRLSDLQAALERCPTQDQRPAEPLVDLERLQELTDGDPEQIRNWINIYLAQAEEILPAIQTAIASQDAAVVNRLAHKLCGASASCGMVAIVPTLRELEMQAKQNDLSRATALHQTACKNLEDMRAFLQNRFGPSSSDSHAP